VLSRLSWLPVDLASLRTVKNLMNTEQTATWPLKLSIMLSGHLLQSQIISSKPIPTIILMHMSRMKSNPFVLPPKFGLFRLSLKLDSSGANVTGRRDSNKYLPAHHKSKMNYRGIVLEPLRWVFSNLTLWTLDASTANIVKQHQWLSNCAAHIEFHSSVARLTTKSSVPIFVLSNAFRSCLRHFCY
jgi:hypothetical protein